MALRKILEGNSSFSTTVPNLQIAWDTVSSGLLKTCPRKYELEIVEGWHPKKMSVHLFFGLLTHSACEVYDHARAAGKSHDDSVILAVKKCFEASGKYRDVSICNDCNAINHFEANVCLWCNSENMKQGAKTWFPWKSDDKNKNLKTNFNQMAKRIK